MRKLLVVFLSLLLCLAPTLPALASDPAIPADSALVASLLPGYTLVTGHVDGRLMYLLMNRPDGELVFVGCQQDAQGAWTLCGSTPLPTGSVLGVENFVHSLGLPSKSGYYDLISVSPFANGVWGISMIYPDHGMPFFNLCPNCILSGDGVFFMTEGIFCDHPWSNISTVDWLTLPHSYEEAIAQLDLSAWAVVSNPNPSDRLHLRAQASRSSQSLGKYYNRTPVRVLERGAQWTKVAIGDMEGFMMTDYLAFGDKMDAVKYAGPWMHVLNETTPLFHRTSDASPTRMMSSQEQFYILGVVGDEWFRIWLPFTNEYLFVRQNELWAGNG